MVNKGTIRNVKSDSTFEYKGRKYKLPFKDDNYSNFRVAITEPKQYSKDFGILFIVNVHGVVTARGMFTAFPCPSVSSVFSVAKNREALSEE